MRRPQYESMVSSTYSKTSSPTYDEEFLTRQLKKKQNLIQALTKKKERKVANIPVPYKATKKLNYRNSYHKHTKKRKSSHKKRKLKSNSKPKPRANTSDSKSRQDINQTLAYFEKMKKIISKQQKINYKNSMSNSKYTMSKSSK